jgi:hypothetical protein
MSSVLRLVLDQGPTTKRAMLREEPRRSSNYRGTTSPGRLAELGLAGFTV